MAAAHPGAVLVRTSLVYGGPVRPDAPPDRMARDPGVTHFTDELRCPILVDDLAPALLELAGADPGLGVAGPVHVAGADGLSRRSSPHSSPAARSPALRPRPGRPLDCRLDSSRALALLATPLRGVREVLATPPP